jgi:hypothetical protein
MFHDILLRWAEGDVLYIWKYFKKRCLCEFNLVPLLALLQRLEEETRTNKYIVTERLPKDISGRRKTLQDLQRVVAEPAMGNSDLDQLNSQVP